ncbi:MAG: aromatic ring-hydroxylating dioxygenase subunit alpha [Gammaproteobacteria bacterium]|nr:aromatic ring-hydroxylating dioxygenase subunit alpha [Gammaproteobacteria bacterium]
MDGARVAAGLDRCWLLAGLESDLERPGDYFVFELGREQILVTRGSDAIVRAFYNVCQHRGNRLVRQERGHANSFRCGYHAWTYATDGRLTAVPHREEFASLPCAERSLRPVHCAVWDGFVFVCMAEDPPTLEEYLGPLPEMLAPYRFRNMTVTQDQTVHHRCNWKAVVDNFSELYHVDFLHPQHRQMVDCSNDAVHLLDNGHSGVQVKGATVNPRFPIPDKPTDLQRGQLENLGLDPADFKRPSARREASRAAAQARGGQPARLRLFAVLRRPAIGRLGVQPVSERDPFLLRRACLGNAAPSASHGPSPMLFRQDQSPAVCRSKAERPCIRGHRLAAQGLFRAEAGRLCATRARCLRTHRRRQRQQEHDDHHRSGHRTARRRSGRHGLEGFRSRVAER